jgi:uncharacterized protein (UPF0210 family)
VKIRSITYFCNPGWPVDEEVLQQAGQFLQAARLAFQAAGYQVQTVRLATTPFPERLPAPETLTEHAIQMEKLCKTQGIDYVALGPAFPDQLDWYAAIPAALAATQNAFFTGSLTTTDGRISLPALRACAQVIHRAAPLSPDGFSNLRFAALANVGPGSPFFPAAYHRGSQPAFALATEAADLAVSVFEQSETLEGAQQGLTALIEQHARKLEAAAASLSQQVGVHFGGIDFSLAPFPDQAISLGAAMEGLGVPVLGLHGSLAAAAILAEIIDRAHFQRVGFSGLFLPVLEDAVLATRAAEGTLGVKDLLLYSAVCGTGLDTLPLPGDTTPEQLTALLADVAALALRLNKPLTARLMPIPGKGAGDPTGFDFDFFANSRVLALHADRLQGLLAGDDSFRLSPRKAL